MGKAKTRATPGPQNRDSSGRFVKGESGNPGGKKWLPDELKVKARGMSLVALEKIGLMLSKSTTTDRDLIAAARLLLEYGYGRPAAEYDKERLELDRARFEAEKAAASAEESRSVEVIISNQASEWGK